MNTLVCNYKIFYPNNSKDNQQIEIGFNQFAHYDDKACSQSKILCNHIMMLSIRINDNIFHPIRIVVRKYRQWCDFDCHFIFISSQQKIS